MTSKLKQMEIKLYKIIHLESAETYIFILFIFIYFYVFKRFFHECMKYANAQCFINSRNSIQFPSD